MNFDPNSISNYFKFYWTAEKVTKIKIDGKGQKFWQIPRSFQPSNLGYYFAFSWMRFKHTDYKDIYARIEISPVY